MNRRVKIESKLSVIRALMIAFSAIAVMALPVAAEEEGVYILGHTVKDIDGQEVNLSHYEGKVVLIVNVASKCGLTPQYEDLMTLHNKYADKGLVILGFPANNFRNQEPGTNAEIKNFCSENYDVKFDMFSKLSVLGEDQAPLYQDLTSAEKNGPFSGEIKWNFTKFLVSKQGKVIARFEPRTKPTDADVIGAIENALAH